MHPVSHGNTAFAHCGVNSPTNWENKEGFELVKAADANGTSPGKDVLKTLLETYAPCVILIDELVAYIRQIFRKDKNLSGGSYDSNFVIYSSPHRSV